MKVKRYRAEDRATALKQIRADLGSDAVIVHEHRVRTGGVFGMFGRVEVEILAAVEERPVAARPPAPAPGGPAAKPAGPTQVASRAGDVEATISAAGRRVASAPNTAPQSAPMDGAGRLAAILEQMPRTGGALTPELTARLADLVANGDGTGPSTGGAMPRSERPAVSPDPEARPGGAARGGVIGSTASPSRQSAASPEATVPEVPLAPETRPEPLPAAPEMASRPVSPGPVELQVSSPILAPAGDGDTPRSGGVLGGATPPEPVVEVPVPVERVVVQDLNGKATAPVDANAALPSAPPTALSDMQHTLSDLRASVDRLMRQQQTQLWPRDLPVVRTIYQHMMAQELDPTLALEVVGQVSDDINEGHPTDLFSVTGRVSDLLNDRMAVSRIPEPTDRPVIIVLVGPTGVGKTTTLAKLAAHLAIAEDRRVALVTTDTFRIAAATQLGTYADLIQVPLEVAYTPEELRVAIQRQSDAEYILIDSPGCAQRNDAQIRELSAFVDAVPGATILLTVAATVKLRDLIDIQSGFGAMPLSGLVLTKLDETTVFGPVMSLVVRSATKAMPVYYVTSGQNVPNDLEEATLDRLSDLLTGQMIVQALEPPPGRRSARSEAGRELVGIGDER